MKDFNTVKKEIDLFGYSVIEDCIDTNILNSIYSKLDSLYKKDQDRFGYDLLMELNEIEQLRNVMEYDPIFVEFLEKHKALDEYIGKLLNKYFVLHNYNLIRLFPEVKSEMLGHVWHRDVYYFGPGIRTAINVMIPLEDTTIENGATELIPGSHLEYDLPNEDFINRNKISAQLKKGDVLLCDASTYHKAGNNKSNKTRTLIVLKYTLSFFKQQYEFCKTLPVESYSDFIKQRIGYNVRVAESLEEFRVRTEDRKYKWTLRN